MNTRTPFVVTALLALAACTHPSSSPAPSTPSDAATATTPAATTATPDAATEACQDDQFVACESGEACATMRGKLVHPRRCFDHAAKACSSLTCAHGCNISSGTPRQIHCAPNASSSSDLKRCGGLANWGCPEKMRCDGPVPPAFDGIGTCVPEP